MKLKSHQHKLYEIWEDEESFCLQLRNGILRFKTKKAAQKTKIICQKGDLES